MKHLTSLLILSLQLCGLFSCTTIQQGTISTISEIKNRSYIDIAIGSAQSTKIMGLGGMDKDALTFEAKRNLFLNYPLKRGEDYANFTVDIISKNYIFYSLNKVTMTADVIGNDTSKNGNLIYSENYAYKLRSSKMLQNSGFKLREKVIILENDEPIIVEIGELNKNDMLVSYNNSSSVFCSKKMSYDEIFKKTNDETTIKTSNFKIDSEIEFSETLDKTPGIENSRKKLVGTIKGIGIDKVLIKTIINNKTYWKTRYFSDIKQKIKE